ncbi:TonB-dependent receptor domain-containing protein [Bacteroidota bacterium]
MKRIFTTSLFLLVAFCAFSQDTGTLKGVLKDADSGETLIGASVVWEADKGRGAATDFDGNYSLSLPVGEQKVVITSIGYETKVVPVSIKKGETTVLNLSIGMASEKLDMVVVSAGKFEQKMEDLTVSVSVIKPGMVESRGSTTAEDALEQTPGLTIVDSEPQMRGGSGYSFGAGARVMLLVDDLPLMSGDAGRPDWGFIPTENLEQIEVIKGASSVLYGSAALNGAINIRTAYPKDKPQTKITLLSGMYSAPEREEVRSSGNRNLPIYGGLSFFHSRKVGQWDLVFGGNIFADNGYIGYEDGDTLANGVPMLKDEETGDLTPVGKPYSNRFRFNFNIRKRSKTQPGLSYGLNGNVLYGRSAGSLIWKNSATDIYRPMKGALTETVQTLLNIDPFFNYSGTKGSRHTLRGRIFYTDNENSNNQANSNTVFFGEYQFAHRFISINDFTVTTGVMSQYTTGVSQLFAANETGTGKNTALNAAGYLQLDKKFWKRLNVNGGVRVEWFKVNDQKSQVAPVFRIGANTKLWKEGYLRASFGQGFRFPTIAERYISTTIGGVPILPNHDLKAERSWGTEVGLMQGIKIGKFLGYADIAGFYQQYQDFVEFNAGVFGKPTNGFAGLAFKSFNTGPARVYGVDVSLMGSGQFTPWFGMNVLVGYTYSRPESLDPFYEYGIEFKGGDSVSTSQLSTTSLLYGSPGSAANPVPTAADTAAFLKNPILKYRFEHLVNADIEFVFTIKKKYKLAIAGTYRYYSYMRSVDRAFYLFDETLLSFVGQQSWGAIEWRKKHSTGDHVFDLRASIELSEQFKFGIVMKNVANREYALRPLKIDAPRTTQVQLTVKF